MKRNDFIKIIKLRSFWKIDKRKGNYKLPNGTYLSSYVGELIESQMKIDSLGIMNDGDLCLCSGGEWNNCKFDDYTLIPIFKENEVCSYNDMNTRINQLIYEIIEK